MLRASDVFAVKQTSEGSAFISRAKSERVLSTVFIHSGYRRKPSLPNWSIKSLTAFATRNGGAEIAALLKKQKLLVMGNSLRYCDRSFIAYFLRGAGYFF
jgi:hypothetical protein